MPKPSDVVICGKCGNLIENAYLNENGEIRCLKCAGLLDREKPSNAPDAERE